MEVHCLNHFFWTSHALTDQGVRNKFLLPIPLIKTLMMAKVVDSFQMLRVKSMTVFTGSKLIWRHVSLVPKRSAYELMMSLPSWKTNIAPWNWMVGRCNFPLKKGSLFQVNHIHFSGCNYVATYAESDSSFNPSFNRIWPDVCKPQTWRRCQIIEKPN